MFKKRLRVLNILYIKSWMIWNFSFKNIWRVLKTYSTLYKLKNSKATFKPKSMYWYQSSNIIFGNWVNPFFFFFLREVNQNIIVILLFGEKRGQSPSEPNFHATWERLPSIYGLTNSFVSDLVLKNPFPSSCLFFSCSK